MIDDGRFDNQLDIWIGTVTFFECRFTIFIVPSATGRNDRVIIVYPTNANWPTITRKNQFFYFTSIRIFPDKMDFGSGSSHGSWISNLHSQ